MKPIAGLPRRDFLAIAGSLAGVTALAWIYLVGVAADMSMPGMDGAECFDRLREIDANARILICTGHGKRDDINAMIEKGALGIVRKPFDMAELSATLKRVTNLVRR